MATLTIRKLPEEVHRALRVRAAMNGRSTEAEVRHILEAAVRPGDSLRMGAALAELGRRNGLANDAEAASDEQQSAKSDQPLNIA